ncbi:small subunit processome component 20 homolog isoform X3 [Apostichopus japonicus]|uniref:small subunit processome component 20 homolog isoform X3 n=1 Tax=Stichopus japonicus TaxID=307972 RepID=UPI003AB3AFEA
MMRKVKTQDDFFEFLFKDLTKNPDHAAGVGRLFFEMMKSVRKQLHSCTPSVLTILLSKLRPRDEDDRGDTIQIDCEVVHQCLLATFQLICRYVNEESALLVWQCLLDLANSLRNEIAQDSKRSVSEEACQHLSYVLQLMEKVVRFGQGKLVTNPKQLVQILEDLLVGNFISEIYSQNILDLLSTLLSAKRCSIGMEQTSSLASYVFKANFQKSQLLHFCRTVAEMNDFEGILLPKLLEYVHEQVTIAGTDRENSELILFTLVELIVMKSPVSGDCLATTSDPYILDFSILVERMKVSSRKKRRQSGNAVMTSFPEFLLDAVNNYLQGEGSIHYIWAVVLCLFNVRPLNKERSGDLLVKLIDHLGDALRETTEEKEMDVLQYVLSCTVQAFLCCSQPKEIKDLEETVLTFMRLYPTSEHILTAAESWYSTATSCAVTVDAKKLAEQYLTLQENLTSSSSKVRLLTLRILSYIPVTLPELPDAPRGQISVLQICQNAEEVPLTLDTYREKLMHLRKLEFEAVKPSLPDDFDCSEVALRYLMGMLHVNLQLLWEPVIDLIKSHAYGMDKNKFWSIYRSLLLQASSELKTLKPHIPHRNRRKSLVTVETAKPQNLADLLQDSLKARMSTTDRPDPINFRNLLWKAMATFPDRVEKKTRDLVPMLLDFVKNEYNMMETFLAPSQDISKKTEDKNLDETEDDADEEGEEEEEKGQGTYSKAKLQKSLVILLQLFSKFRNPKAFFQENKMRELFFRLLSSSNASVQKVTLDCVMTYKFKYLQPYVEQFSALMEDKSFTDALLLFNIDEESGLIEDHHRDGLLPVLFRILYGKMLSRAGAGPQGKSGVSFRRSLILRFLGGSKEAEMKIFLDLIFEPFMSMLDEDCSSMLKKSLEALDISSVIPLRRQYSILETCGILFSRVGHLIGSYNSTILHILISMAANYNSLLEKRDELQPHAIKQLKNLRQSAVNRLEQFSEVYDEYPYTSDEIDSLFEGVVWPQLDRLQNEGLAGPTPLLKLFHQWSKQPRLHILLAKHHPTQADLYPIPGCIALLSSSLAAPTVVAMVMEVIYNLLNLEESDPSEDDDVAPLPVNDVIPMSEVKVPSEEVVASFGIRLIHPFVSPILQYLKTAVKPRKTRFELPLKEINLLSKLSLFVEDPVQSSNLISLLLPYLEKTKDKHENIEVDILNTVKNLVIYVDDASQFINKLSKCFQRLSFRTSRKVLCDVISAMATRLPEMAESAKFVQDLNSWDKKRLDEPDYSKRISTFNLANRKVEQMKDVDTTFLQLMLDNAFYFVVKMDEMSMRDNSSFFLINFIQHSASLESGRGAIENLIHSKYLPSLKEGVKSRRESTRHECIAILSGVIKHYPHLDVFDKMTVLHDKDKERDFYENIRHIQIHRRVRALRKLAKHCRQSELDVKGVRNFLLPLVTGVIFDPVLVAKNENVVLEAIDCIGAIAGMMPWGTYFILFKQFLRLLLRSVDQQKIAVRLLVAVLEAFHFDLTTSEYLPREQPGFLSEVDLDGNGEVKKDGVEDDKSKTEESLEEQDEPEKDEEEMEDEESKVTENVKDQATRIHKTILNSVLPKLMEIFSERTKRDEQHKVTRDNGMDENEILRIPLTVAMVKLIKELPHNAVNTHLPSIVLKVCNILKHRIMNIRDIARDCLIKILHSAGVDYFDGILHQMNNTLTRGYQVHVLGYSVHALIKSIPNLKSGDLDKSLPILIKILNGELFGDLSEEKEVAAIISKVPEAKGTRSYDCYEIIGKVIGEGALTMLILPLKELLDTTHSHKVVNKVREVLRRFSIGLVANSALSVESLMIFIHGLASDTLHLVTSFEKAKAALRPPPDPRLQPPSVYLLPAKPKRWGESAHMGRKTNMHVLMEFGLLLLHNALKSSKLSPSKELHLRMLDPFVDILTKALGAKTNVVVSVSVRCLTNMLRFPLPSLETTSEEITKSLFHLLKKHAGAGVTKGENLELITNTFKAVTVLVRDVKHHKINEKQLQVLLAYAEEDINDYTRQATAFTLLKAILFKKLVVPEIHEVVRKIRQLAITSETPSIRAQCRQVDLQYLLDYPLGRKIKTPLEFYVSQLSYQVESGRRSALDMLMTMFNTFPQPLLLKYAGLFFIPLSIRLVNDESTSCRRLAASTLKTLLKKLDNVKCEELFEMVKQWLTDDDAGHQRLAVQLCGVFVEAEGADSHKRLGFILPALEEKIRSENWNQETPSQDPDDEKESDHLLFHLFSCLLKVLKTCHIIKSDEYQELLNAIWRSAEEHLLHPHTWIRIVTAQLYGELFATWPYEKLISVFGDGDDSLHSSKDTGPYILSDGRSKVKVLTTKFCGQLLSSQLKKDHANQILKNLVYLGKVMHKVYPMDKTESLSVDDVIQGDDLDKRLGEDKSDHEEAEDEDEDSDDDDDTSQTAETNSNHDNNSKEDSKDTQRSISIAWMVRKLCWICSNEAFRSHQETFRRSAIVKWFAALALDMDPADVKRCLPPIIRVLLRSIDDHNKHNDDNLKVLCQEVLELLKGVVELEFFTRTYADVQRSRQEKRLQRKRQNALEAVANPEEAAKKKMKKNLKKKESKKRKIKKMRPTYALTKKMKFTT